MILSIKRLLLALALTGSLATVSIAQEVQTKEEKEAAYTKVITERAGKIVATLGISDEEKFARVRSIIAGQYRNLNAIHDSRNAAVKRVKEEQKENKEAAAEEVKQLEDRANEQLTKLHKKYLKNLCKELNRNQVEKVKDGMTYGVLPITYRGYQEMLPNLTKKQKKQILAWLTEARELAMDAESSEKKHGWFGKYKGRINNYLSAAGINMKQASLDWQKRIKEQAEAKKSK